MSTRRTWDRGCDARFAGHAKRNPDAKNVGTSGVCSFFAAMSFAAASSGRTGDGRGTSGEGGVADAHREASRGAPDGGVKTDSHPPRDAPADARTVDGAASSIPYAAPEIVRDGTESYIAALRGDLQGIQIARLTFSR